MIWVILYLALTFIGIGVVAAKHGEPCEYNFWITLGADVIIIFILYKGNFFNPLFG